MKKTKIEAGAIQIEVKTKSKKTRILGYDEKNKHSLFRLQQNQKTKKRTKQ